MPHGVMQAMRQEKGQASFALDTKAEEIGALVREFMKMQK